MHMNCCIARDTLETLIKSKHWKEGILNFASGLNLISPPSQEKVEGLVPEKGTWQKEQEGRRHNHKVRGHSDMGIKGQELSDKGSLCKQRTERNGVSLEKVTSQIWVSENYFQSLGLQNSKATYWCSVSKFVTVCPSSSQNPTQGSSKNKQSTQILWHNYATIHQENSRSLSIIYHWPLGKDYPQRC